MSKQKNKGVPHGVTPSLTMLCTRKLQTCSLPLELGWQLTAKGYCHQLYGQTSVKIERNIMPAGFTHSQTAGIQTLRCRLQM